MGRRDQHEAAPRAAIGMRVAARAIADALQRLAGEAAKGEFRCLDCGYGIVITHTLPACPMCRGRGWQEADWRPFTRASNIA